jgi:hypothetical protein
MSAALDFEVSAQSPSEEERSDGSGDEDARGEDAGHGELSRLSLVGVGEGCSRVLEWGGEKNEERRR